MDWGTIASIAAVAATIFTTVGAIIITLRYFVEKIEMARNENRLTIDSLIEKIDGVRNECRLAIEANHREYALVIDKKDALDSRARHDEANRVTGMYGELRRDVELLKREVVRREDMIALETRLKSGQDKIEIKVDRLDEKIDQLLMMRRPDVEIRTK